MSKFYEVTGRYVWDGIPQYFGETTPEFVKKALPHLEVLEDDDGAVTWDAKDWSVRSELKNKAEAGEILFGKYGTGFVATAISPRAQTIAKESHAFIAAGKGKEEDLSTVSPDEDGFLLKHLHDLGLIKSVGTAPRGR